MPMIDVYCTDCGIWIDGDGYISNGGVGPLCEDCNEIEKLHEGLANDSDERTEIG